MTNILKKLIQHQNLTSQESTQLMRQLMQGKINPALAGAILTALTVKGETVDEIAAMAQVMRKFSIKVKIDRSDTPLLDTCGTGGSGLEGLNVSTASAFILAACGVRIAKHGNRKASSKCGSFDALEGLGARIDLGPNQVAKLIQLTGIGFMFAPLYHPAMCHVVPVRRALGIRTVFNFLGPLCNPAGAKYHVLGVSSVNLAPKLLKVLKKLKFQRALVVHGTDGLDEITLTAPTKVWELKQSGITRHYTIKPEQFGIKRVKFDAIKGGTVKYNTKVIIDVLSGRDKSAKRDIIALNAAAGLYIAGKAKNIKQGLNIAQSAIDSGAAQAKLVEYIKLSKKI